MTIGSIAGSEPYPGGAGYSTAKLAVRAVMGVLRQELLGRPIRVCEIDPGMVETEFSLVRFDGDAERAAAVYAGVEPLSADDVAECVRWVASRPPHVNIDQMIVWPATRPAPARSTAARPDGGPRCGADAVGVPGARGPPRGPEAMTAGEPGAGASGTRGSRLPLRHSQAMTCGPRTSSPREPAGASHASPRLRHVGTHRLGSAGLADRAPGGGAAVRARPQLGPTAGTAGPPGRTRRAAAGCGPPARRRRGSRTGSCRRSAGPASTSRSASSSAAACARVTVRRAGLMRARHRASSA